MRIATWNVNSLKARLPRVEEFLGYADVDVLCLQETKLSDKAFPALTFSGLGYESVHNGQGQWNGVAILSRVGIANVTNGFDDAYVDPYDGDSRIVAADCGGSRLVHLNAPHGRGGRAVVCRHNLAERHIMDTFSTDDPDPHNPPRLLE